MDDFEDAIDMEVDEDDIEKDSDESSDSENEDEEIVMKAGFKDLGRINMDFKHAPDRYQKILDNYKKNKNVLLKIYKNEKNIEQHKEKLKYLNHKTLIDSLKQKKYYSVDETRYLTFLNKIFMDK
mgnify:CR=1 FL=1|uniref:Uncharacterized protein n=1 Tax=viral metagenome TaxID=1070528 RepID=A0A6C0J8T3_9ZZZZ